MTVDGCPRRRRRKGRRDLLEDDVVSLVAGVFSNFMEVESVGDDSPSGGGDPFARLVAAVTETCVGAHVGVPFPGGEDGVDGIDGVGRDGLHWTV